MHVYNITVSLSPCVCVLQEITQVMQQGVNVFIAMMPTDYYAFYSQEFFECLFSESLLDGCKAVVARITAPSNGTSRRRRGQTQQSPEAVMKQYGLDPKKLKCKLCTLFMTQATDYACIDYMTLHSQCYNNRTLCNCCNNPCIKALLKSMCLYNHNYPPPTSHPTTDVVADEGSKKAKKSKRKGKEGGVKEGVATLRSELLGEERRTVVVQPVKETITAGKALLGLGHRLGGWLATLGRAAH